MPLWGWAAAAVLAYLLLSPSSPPPLPTSSAMGNVANLPDSFWQTLWAVANRLGATPEVLGLILFEESGINPAAQNSIHCVGINQFCTGTYERYVSMSKADYLALSAEEQLTPYVEHYWRDKPKGGLATARDIFWLSLLPATWPGPNADPSTVVNDPSKLVYAAQQQGITPEEYAARVSTANPIGQTGDVITAGDIDRYMTSIAGSPGWQLALQKIAANDPSGSNA